jgi:hypothetical protein
MKHGARPEQMTLGPCENDLDPPKSMVSDYAPYLAASIADLRQRIAVVRPRVAECVRVAPRINELADAIQRGDVNRPEAVTMQAEINELWASLPPVREQTTIVLAAAFEFLDRLPTRSVGLQEIRAEIMRTTSGVLPAPFFKFGGALRDLQIFELRLAEMLSEIDTQSTQVDRPGPAEINVASDNEVSAMASPETGTEEKKWRMVKNLGGGGQGLIEVVTREGDPTEYVRKRLKNIDSLDRRKRFDDELRAYRELSHPNIVTLIDFGTESSGKQRPFIVTEYCSGGSLEDGRWKRGNIRQVLEDFVQVCQGLACAHDRGVIHRDIKPANVFQRADGSLAVGDFGLCLFGDDGDRITATEEVAGSRWYCAPELGDGRLDRIGPSCDVYSLGKLLYWMLTGRIFDREKHRDEPWVIGRADLPFPIYELVNQLLDRMIVADPWKRYQNSGAVAESVRGLLRIDAAGGHAIGLGIPLLCTFCANGTYIWHADPFHNKDRARTQASNFGVSQVGDPMWMILICPTCANVQLFRPDLAPDAKKVWQRKP